MTSPDSPSGLEGVGRLPTEWRQRALRGALNRKRAGHLQSGFSLIELAVVLVIVGLLVGGGIVALEATTEQARRSDQKHQLSEVREALYGFAMARGRLPCPDTSYPPDGTEDIVDLSPGDSFACPIGDPTDDADCECDAKWGALPWVALGVERRDAWGNPLRYRVDDVAPNFANPDANHEQPAFELVDDTGSIEVVDGEGTTLVDTAPAIVVSYGPQGDQIWADAGFNCPAAGARGFSADEVENCDDNNRFVDAGYRKPDAGADPTQPGEGRFDDLLIWISTPVLKARMVDARRLPR